MNCFEKETLTKKKVCSGAKMLLTETEKYVAKQKLEYKGGSGALIYFSTVWKDEPVLIYYNTATDSIFNVTCFQDLSEEDIDMMRKLISNYKSLSTSSDFVL